MTGTRPFAVSVLTLVLLAGNCSLAFGQCEYGKILEGVRRNEYVGLGVAVHGSLVAVGVPGANDAGRGAGVVQLFEYNNGRIQRKDRLTANDPNTGDGLGFAVACHGDLLVASAPGKDTSKGAAYVFERVDGRWVQTAKLVASDGGREQQFGSRVAVHRERIAVAARYAWDGQRSGAVYVFERDAQGGWSQVARLVPDDRVRSAQSVAIYGDILVSGAPEAAFKGNWSGAAYVFERGGDGIWRQSARLLASDGRVHDGFGQVVAVRGETLLIGASGRRRGIESVGGVYVFERDESGAWREGQIFERPEPEGSFPRSLAVDGRLLLAGVVGVRHKGVSTGAGYVFAEDAAGRWNPVGKLLPSDPSQQDEFGTRVAIGGNLALMGAPWDDVDHLPQDPWQGVYAGSAYLYAVSDDEDGDGVMDACECPGDLDGDRDVDLADLAALLSCLGRGENCADVDEDGRTDGADLAALLAHWGVLCPR